MTSAAKSRTYLPIVVSGPSGVGKGTWVSRLLERHHDVFVTAISHKNRKPRSRELEAPNQPYYFVDPAEFQSLVDQNAFAEHTYFAGNYYGTSWQTLLDQQGQEKRLIMDIDTDGVKDIRDKSDHFAVRCAFIAPPSIQVLEDRLRGRGTETEAIIEMRLE